MRRSSLSVCALPGSAAAATPVTVSLTFDDGWDSQQTAATMLAAHGLKGTFYVNSANIDQPGYLTWAQLTAMNAAGQRSRRPHAHHPDLTTLTSTQAQHEICDDRTNIQSHGFVVPDFAYPCGAYDSNTGGGTLDVSSIVRNCGYASGRGAFGLHNITATNDTRAYATSISPSNLVQDPDAVLHQLRVLRRLHADGRGARELRPARTERNLAEPRLGDLRLPSHLRQLRRRQSRALR